MNIEWKNIFPVKNTPTGFSKIIPPLHKSSEIRYSYRMKNKSLTFLLALTFLVLFSGSVFGEEPEKKVVPVKMLENFEEYSGEFTDTILYEGKLRTAE